MDSTGHHQGINAYRGCKLLYLVNQNFQVINAGVQSTFESFFGMTPTLANVDASAQVEDFELAYA